MVSYPACRLHHLELQGVSKGLISEQCNSVTAGQGRLHVTRRQEFRVRDQFRETSSSSLRHSPHIQTLFCQSSCLGETNRTRSCSTDTWKTSRRNVSKFQPHLIETKHRDLATNVDAWRTNAENIGLLQPALSVNSSGGDGCRQGRRHRNGHNVQASND